MDWAVGSSSATYQLRAGAQGLQAFVSEQPCGITMSPTLPAPQGCAEVLKRAPGGRFLQVALPGLGISIRTGDADSLEGVPRGPRGLVQTGGSCLMLPRFLLFFPLVLMSSPSNKEPELGAETSANSLRLAFLFDPEPGTELALGGRMGNGQMNKCSAGSVLRCMGFSWVVPRLWLQPAWAE